MKLEWLFASVVAWLLTVAVLVGVQYNIEHHRWLWLAVNLIALPACVFRASKWWTRGAR